MLINRFFEEEERDGYIVTAKHKRIWAVELNMLEMFDKFCEENGLRYYAGFGTLLGTVRHRGFIPWDDDIDLVMPRPDYEKMKRLAPDAFRYPIVFQPSSYIREMNLILPFSKLRDSRTSAVGDPDAPIEIPQGIFIDIFPLDSVGDGTAEGQMQLNIKAELYCALSQPAEFLKDTAEGHTLFDMETARQLTDMPKEDLFIIFEDNCLKSYDATDKIDYLMNYGGRDKFGWDKSWYGDSLKLPFEHLMLPAPTAYDEILSSVFGSYMTPVIGGGCHDGSNMDPDVPYYVNLNIG